MIAGAALGSRAIGDVTRRALACEWTGPEPAGQRDAARAEAIPKASDRRVTPQKP
ncbi:hypothetical protein FHR22_004069 [Sphingopyxis panaciterrae]|uniref:hypothetical protein n=1 Tax=Sphingopyxis panaciterrae TaxID=363841 RepID=UPI0014209985|nr:hypothetical protein [Sphingopyxis panaciterrae]NIJ39322.1 hypothetical protein [Sphingopyxis panaciterrae]